MGLEHRGKGVNVALGPMMNMGRIAQGGRNWEGFGADPFLTGEAAYETVLGMQAGGVQACAKHLIGKYVLLFGYRSFMLLMILSVSKNTNAHRLLLILTTGLYMKFMPTPSFEVLWLVYRV